MKGQERQACRMVPQYGAGRVIEVPVVRIVYQNVCYNVNVPQCSTGGCGAVGGGCAQGQSVCSRNEFTSNTVCPFAQGGQQQLPQQQGVAPQPPSGLQVKTFILFS